MYADNDAAYFLDSGDYNQYSLPRDEVTNELQYITEDLQGMLALIYNGQCVGIQLPTAVDLKITRVRPSRTRQLGHVAHETGHARNRAYRSRARVLEAG